MGKGLVIGATGTIERLLVPRLLARGTKVRELVYREFGLPVTFLKPTFFMQVS